MNTSLYFINLSEDEICKILDVVSVPYLMEPLKRQPERYLAGRRNAQSLSREAVNHIYLQFLKNQDPVLSLYMSDIVVDIIHYFKLSDGFKNLLTSDDPAFVEELSKKIKKRQCPITVDMFMRLLDHRQSKRQVETPKEPKFFDIEQNQKKSEPVQPAAPVDQPASTDVPTERVVTLEKEEAELELEEDEPVIEAQYTEVSEPEVASVTDQPVAQEQKQTSETDEMIKDLQYQIMTLQMENESLKEENRSLLFDNEEENEIQDLKREIEELKHSKEQLSHDLTDLSVQNTTLQQALKDFDEHKKKHNQVLLELRDYKIKYISLQAEMDQMRYTMKNDSKKIKELENKQRSVYDNEADWMMAMHDLTWYKKQWNLPGDAPLHKIWAHLNREEATRLAHLLKHYDRLLRTERKKEIDALKEILIVKEAILILLRSDKAMEQAKEAA